MKNIQKTEIVNWKLMEPDALSVELQDFNGDHDLD